MKKIIIIGTYPHDDYNEKILSDCIDSVTGFGFDIMITSHYPLPQYIQEKVNYCIFDKDNSHDPVELSPIYFQYNDIFRLRFRNCCGRISTITKNMFNGISLSKNLGYDSFYYMESDNIIHSEDVFKLVELNSSMIENGKKMIFFSTDSEGSKIYESLIFGGTPNFILDKFQLPVSNLLLSEFEGDISLERLFYSILNNFENEFIIIPTQSSYFLSNSSINITTHFSDFAILKNYDDNNFVFFIANHRESKINIQFNLNNGPIITVPINSWYIIELEYGYNHKLEIIENEIIRNYTISWNESKKLGLDCLEYIKFL